MKISNEDLDSYSLPVKITKDYWMKISDKDTVIPRKITK